MLLTDIKRNLKPGTLNWFFAGLENDLPDSGLRACAFFLNYKKGTIPEENITEAFDSRLSTDKTYVLTRAGADGKITDSVFFWKFKEPQNLAFYPEDQLRKLLSFTDSAKKVLNNENLARKKIGLLFVHKHEFKDPAGNPDTLLFFEPAFYDLNPSNIVKLQLKVSRKINSRITPALMDLAETKYRYYFCPECQAS